MDAVWIGRSGTKHGPYPARQVLDAHTNGKLLATDLLWWQGLEGWLALDAGLDKLRSQLGVAAPPVAAPVAQPAARVETPATTGTPDPVSAATELAAVGTPEQPVETRRSEQAGSAMAAGAVAAASASTTWGTDSATRSDRAQVDPYRAPTAEVADPSEPVQEFAYAGFWVRFAAFVLDTLVVSFAGFLLGSVIGFALVFGASGGEPLMVASQLAGIVIGWLYYAFFESGSARATPGKMAFRLQVVHVDTGEPISFARATGRFFGKILSGLLLGIGYLMQPFTARKQALHDLISSASVVETGPYSRVLLWVCLFIAFVPLFLALIAIGFLLFGLGGLRLR